MKSPAETRAPDASGRRLQQTADSDADYSAQAVGEQIGNLEGADIQHKLRDLDEQRQCDRKGDDFPHMRQLVEECPEGNEQPYIGQHFFVLKEEVEVGRYMPGYNAGS